MLPARSFSIHKRSLKLKSQERYEDIYRVKIAELRDQDLQNDGKMLNFIDMSKDYGGELQES
jgi:hypothetical protein